MTILFFAQQKKGFAYPARRSESDPRKRGILQAQGVGILAAGEYPSLLLHAGLRKTPKRFLHPLAQTWVLNPALALVT